MSRTDSPRSHEVLEGKFQGRVGCHSMSCQSGTPQRPHKLYKLLPLLWVVCQNLIGPYCEPHTSVAGEIRLVEITCPSCLLAEMKSKETCRSCWEYSHSQSCSDPVCYLEACQVRCVCWCNSGTTIRSVTNCFLSGF